MTKQPQDPKNSKTQLAKKAKLAEALRQNLLRRKGKKEQNHERETTD